MRDNVTLKALGVIVDTVVRVKRAAKVLLRKDRGNELDICRSASHVRKPQSRCIDCHSLTDLRYPRSEIRSHDKLEALELSL